MSKDTMNLREQPNRTQMTFHVPANNQQKGITTF